ncbi:MAG: amidase, partial [Pyrinomonadaceae bacterium]|nr:amidase [Pyrinomonadaceae bacterium]
MTSMERREFVGLSAAGLIGALAAKGAAFGADNKPAAAVKFAEATVAELQQMMKNGELTAVDISEGYLKNIEQLDKRINSIIEINPEALEIADRLDKERKAGKVRGPLHGIPVVIKDNIDTADKMKTTAGSLALVNAPVPKQDAFIVQRLREAGAVILAKTNLSEWANFRDNDSISGWSGRGGQTRNPYVLDRNPCGSSSGTGAAISANLAAIGIGTETDGSIVCPSSVNGIVGLKPTVGLVSRSGIIPIAHSQDTAGPMTRTVADAAVMLSALVGVDSRDGETANSRGKFRTDYESYLKADGLKGARIGVVRNYWGRRDVVDKTMDKALEAMKAAGATLVDVRMDSIGKYGDAEFQVLLYEFKAGLEKYLAERGGDHKTLNDLIQFNIDNAAREMPYFRQGIFETAAKKGPLTTKEYTDALALSKRLTREEGIDLVMDKEKLDALVAPVSYTHLTLPTSSE